VDLRILYLQRLLWLGLKTPVVAGRNKPVLNRKVKSPSVGTFRVLVTPVIQFIINYQLSIYSEAQQFFIKRIVY
jgi:hypothetical protein